MMKARVQFDSDDEDEKRSEDESSAGVSGVNIFDAHDAERDATHPPKGGHPSLGRRLSWTSVSTMNLCEPLYMIAIEDKKLAEKFKVLLRNPEFDRDDLLCSVHNFVGSLADYVPSIKQDKTFTVFKSIRSFLSSGDSTRLFALLIHFTYWHIIHPTARSTMRALQEVEELKLFTNVDVMTYKSEKRQRMPLALQQIDAKDLQPQGAHKTFSQIDHMFQQEVNQHTASNYAALSPTASPHDAGMALSVSSMDTDASLSATEKEGLFIQLESCVIALFKKMGQSRFALVTGRQALISCCHFVVDEVLSMLYPWFASVHEEEEGDGHRVSSRHGLGRRINNIDLKLRRLVHQSISDLIDPSRVYTSTMLLNALLGYDSSSGIKSVSKKARGVMANEGKGKFYRTSASMLAILGDSNSYQARKFLHRGGSLYVSLPGVVKPYSQRHERKEDTGPRGMLAKIVATETAKEMEKEEQRVHPKAIDFNNLFLNQPEANYFPVLETDSSSKDMRPPPNTLHSAGQLALLSDRGHGHHPVTKLPLAHRRRVFPDLEQQSLADSLTLSEGHPHAASPQAELPISLKAKAVLMNLMVDKTAKLYTIGVQTDKTAMKIAMIKGVDHQRQHK